MNSIFKADSFKIGFNGDFVSQEHFLSLIKSFEPRSNNNQYPLSLNAEINSVAQFFNLLENKNEVVLNSDVITSRKYTEANFVLPTSGTTGKPKQVHYDYRLFVEHVSNKPSIYGTKSISFISLNHIGSINALFHHIFRSGEITFIPVAKTTELDLNDVIEKNEINNLILTPSILQFISGSLNHPCQSVKKVIFGGEMLLEKHQVLTQKYFPNAVIKNRYGITEAGIVDQKSKHDNSIKLVEGEYKVDNSKLFVKKPKYIIGDVEWINTGDICSAKGGVITIKGRNDLQLSLNGNKINLQKVKEQTEKLDEIISAKAYVKAYANSSLEILCLDIITLEKDLIKLKSKIRREISCALPKNYIPSLIEFNKPNSTKFI